jgi:hypothetical protein
MYWIPSTNESNTGNNSFDDTLPVGQNVPVGGLTSKLIQHHYS